MGFGPTRYFCNAIHEYAVSIGKENFYIIGEITGNNESKFDTVTETGLNAALGITDLQQMLWQLPKGMEEPQACIPLFKARNTPRLTWETEILYPLHKRTLPPHGHPCLARQQTRNYA
jgi:hypothetical protein